MSIPHTFKTTYSQKNTNDILHRTRKKCKIQQSVMAHPVILSLERPKQADDKFGSNPDFI